MSHCTVSARVRVHATFTTHLPAPLFIIGVEVLAGKIEPTMFVNIPLNSAIAMTVRILALSKIKNDFDVDLLGLAIKCDNEELRSLIDSLNIGDEIWDITIEGQD